MLIGVIWSHVILACSLLLHRRGRRSTAALATSVSPQSFIICLTPAISAPASTIGTPTVSQHHATRQPRAHTTPVLNAPSPTSISASPRVLNSSTSPNTRYVTSRLNTSAAVPVSAAVPRCQVVPTPQLRPSPFQVIPHPNSSRRCAKWSPHTSTPTVFMQPPMQSVLKASTLESRIGEPIRLRKSSQN